MPEPLDVAVVGAGPYGLSVAASLPELSVRVFGTPMETWRTRMRPEMLLRSAWRETSLAAAGGRGSIDEWAAATGEAREEPLPLAKFLRYADWFRERFVADLDTADVALVEPAGERYRVVNERSDEVEARHVVVAVGVTPFGHAPPPFDRALGAGVSHAIDRHDFAGADGRSVVVVGGGQNALEAAALAARAGADAELVVRSQVRWFADREPHYERGRVGTWLYGVAYPAVGYGPPVLNRLVLHPDLFAALPTRWRVGLTRRLLRAGGSPWLREHVVGKVRLSEGRSVVALDCEDGRLRLRLDDGSTRVADEVVLATGYRFSLDRLPFLAPELRTRIRVEDDWPVLDRCFRTTDRGVFFVGYAAERRFGALSRFVLGVEFTARRLRSALVPDRAAS